MRKKTRSSQMRGRGIVTDVGSILFPVLGTVAGGTLGSSLGPVGSALGGAFGEEGGKALNDWLKTMGLGSGRSLQGNGAATDILKRAKEELGPKIYKGVVSILKNGFDLAREVDKSGIVNVAQKWLNLFRMGRGRMNATTRRRIGMGKTVGLNGLIQQTGYGYVQPTPQLLGGQMGYYAGGSGNIYI